MRQYFLSLASATALLVALSAPAFAQDDVKEEKKKDTKIKQYDEIIVRKKTDKDGKVTIEIKDGEVTVNGKKLEDFDDANLSVRRNKQQHVIINGASPFRSQGGAWSYGGNGPATVFPGEAKSAFLGVATGEGKDGAPIEEVTDGSAADKAGLSKGDVIIRIDDVKVFSQDDISREVTKHKPEDKVTITFKHDGKEQKTTATLGKRSSAQSFGGNFQMPDLQGLQGLQNFDFKFDDKAFSPRVYGMAAGRPRLGIRAQDTEDGKGVKVLSLEPESTAEKAGIKEEDIITDFDGKVVNSADELAEAAKAARDKPAVTVKLKRDGKVQTIEIKTPKKLKTAEL